MQYPDVRALVFLDLLELVVVKDHTSLRPTLMAVIARGVVMSSGRDASTFVLYFVIIQ